MRLMVLLIVVLPFETAMSAERIDYLSAVKPILKSRCFACHGSLKQEAGLRLDTLDLMLQGGDSGPVIHRNDSKTSLLIERISNEDEDSRMPPQGEPLSPEQIEAVRGWINQGANAPKDEKPEEDPRNHWAFQRISRPPLPADRHISEFHNPIDAFISARHNSLKLAPAPLAPRHVLLRRVSLDLIGMPPTREELLTFLADDSPSAYEAVVDHLLDDPRHGERWARHWMDVWRYSDWYGRRHVPDVWNSAPQIWRWRDWIVTSLNRDHGYNRMLREMLAGDEVSPEDEEAGYATGYLIRNWYALNPNDWMRNTVEHTGKAFLGLTFNCAHCHDHKYDPITQDDYFRLRAFFEPISIRQDRVAGQDDPGPFQEYDYGKLRSIQRVGAVRIFDKNPDAPTWFYTGGDERNRTEERGSAEPGVPEFLAGSFPAIQPVELPPAAWYPGLRPDIRETMLAEARGAIMRAETAVAAAEEASTEPAQAALDHLSEAQQTYDAALSEIRDSEAASAISGQQSLFFDATQGRQVISHRLPGLTSLNDGFTLEFQLWVLNDTHFNFQFAKDVDEGLTAGYVAFEEGHIVSYRPGSFTEFETGRYDFARQNRFHVKLKLDTQRDQCLLTVRSLMDQEILVDQAPVALNGWNPVGDSTKGIFFDARTGSRAAVDELILEQPVPDDPDRTVLERVAYFDFESPAYPAGSDVVGLDNWEQSRFSVAPATSIVSAAMPDHRLRVLRQHVEAAYRAVLAPSYPLKVAEAQLAAARAALEAIEARIAADRAKYGESPGQDAKQLAHSASRFELQADVRDAEWKVLEQERVLAVAESKPATDTERPKDIAAGSKALAAAMNELTTARRELEDDSRADSYSPLSAMYPQTSTGRRRALAQWMTNRDNPLTARVAVNHIWMRHFHVPLVASVDDFGRNGKSATHPQLMDWLAAELMDSNWSMKHLHRMIVLSEAYRRTTAVGGESGQVDIDPENTFLWRMNTGRMEAEVVRDSLLFCAGLLDLEMGGQELENSESLKTYRRSLYYAVYPEDGGKSPLGELFDGPNALECYRRARTIVPQQALALTNSDLVHKVSTAIVVDWSRRSERPNTLPKERESEMFVTAMFERILSRDPSAAELKLCVDALRSHPAVVKKDTEENLTRARESLVRSLLNHNDFVTIR